MNLQSLNSISPRELAAIQAALPTLSLQEKMELFEALEEKERRVSRDLAKTNLIGFAKHVYPGFKVGPHHKKLARIFEDVLSGKKKRVSRKVVNLPRRPVLRCWCRWCSGWSRC
jgi:phosphoribosyl-dephospho-CoA transferase